METGPTGYPEEAREKSRRSDHEMTMSVRSLLAWFRLALGGSDPLGRAGAFGTPTAGPDAPGDLPAEHPTRGGR